MKKRSLILLFVTLFCGCSNYNEVQNSDTEFSPMTKDLNVQMNSSVVVNYLNSGEKIFKLLKNINSKISSKELKEMVDIYNLYKSSPQTYQSILELKVKNIYSTEDIALLEDMYNNLLNYKNQLQEKHVLNTFSKNETESLLTTFVLKIPSVNERILNLPGLTRASNNESECLERCNDNYRWELIGIASEAVCVAGLAVISACASLGSLGIPALIALIVEYAKMDYALASAERAYNQCKADC